MMDRRVYLAARVRPLTPREISMGAKSCIVVDGSCTTLVNPDTGDAKAFVLDYSFDSSDPSDRSGWQADNDTIFRDLGTQVLKHALEGYKTCLFAHGQMGAGKTYTLVGQESDPGLVPRILEALFQQEAITSGKLFVTASFYEIKDEQVRDILKANLYTPGGLKVRSLQSGCVIEGLTVVPLENMTACEELLAQVLKFLGAIESSSHTIFSLELYTPDNAVDERGQPLMIPYSSLRIVDLAGAKAAGGGSSDEIAKKIGGKGKGLGSQDKSLLAWANVMAALAENQHLSDKQQLEGHGSPKAANAKVHVPFRGSMLTRVLEESLGHLSRTYIIANLSPSHLSHKETLNTFRHIVRTKEVKRVARNEAILSQYLGGPEFIPAAGGGWRWSYTSKFPDQQPPT